MKELYVKCKYCNLIFKSGFQAISATQVIGFFYLCPKCNRIVLCDPPDYLEKINNEFRKMMADEEIFIIPSGGRVEVQGPVVYNFSDEVKVKAGAFVTSDKAIVRYEKSIS